jgi:predicted nucleic acid-binding protein
MAPRHPIRTFLDAGVLIIAYGTQRPYTNVALEVLRDPDRIFLSSPFVWHEVCPKALFNHRQQEYRFYLEYFQRTAMLNDVRLILEHAGHEAARSGVGAMDSLHIAAAHLLEADEFITTELPRKSIYRTKLVKVVYLFE